MSKETATQNKVKEEKVVEHLLDKHQLLASKVKQGNVVVVLNDKEGMEGTLLARLRRMVKAHVCNAPRGRIVINWRARIAEGKAVMPAVYPIMLSVQTKAPLELVCKAIVEEIQAGGIVGKTNIKSLTAEVLVEQVRVWQAAINHRPKPAATESRLALISPLLAKGSGIMLTPEIINERYFGKIDDKSDND